MLDIKFDAENSFTDLSIVLPDANIPQKTNRKCCQFVKYHLFHTA